MGLRNIKSIMNNTHTIYVAILLHKTIILVYNGTINIEKQLMFIQERFYIMIKKGITNV